MRVCMLTVLIEIQKKIVKLEWNIILNIINYINLILYRNSLNIIKIILKYICVKNFH